MPNLRFASSRQPLPRLPFQRVDGSQNKTDMLPETRRGESYGGQLGEKPAQVKYGPLCDCKAPDISIGVKVASVALVFGTGRTETPCQVDNC